jgi:hypothetical protein
VAGEDFNAGILSAEILFDKKYNCNQPLVAIFYAGYERDSLQRKNVNEPHLNDSCFTAAVSTKVVTACGTETFSKTHAIR